MIDKCLLVIILSQNSIDHLEYLKNYLETTKQIRSVLCYWKGIRTYDKGLDRFVKMDQMLQRAIVLYVLGKTETRNSKDP